MFQLDVEANTEEEDDLHNADGHMPGQTAVKAIFIKDLANNILIPELELLTKYCPAAMELIQQTKHRSDNGRPTITLAMQIDGCSYVDMRRFTVKLEQLVLKLLVPDQTVSAQRCTELPVYNAFRIHVWCGPRHALQFIL